MAAGGSREPGGLARLTITLPAAQALEKGRFTPVALSPDGKLLVYAAAREEDGRPCTCGRSTSWPPARFPPRGAPTPFFSPDGRWLAFYANGLLKKVRWPAACR